MAEAGEVEILAGGELRFGLTTAEDEQLSDGEGDRGYAFFTDSELYIEADVSPSDDLEIGAKVVLEADADIEEVNADETYMFVESGFGLLQLGRTEGAEDSMALGADTIAAGTGGIDGDTENLGEVAIVNSGDAAKISYYTPRFFGVQAGLSVTPDTGDDEGGATDLDEDDELVDLDDHLGVGINALGDLGEFEVGLAVVGSYGKSGDAAGDDLDAFSVGGTLGLGELEVGASAGRSNAADDIDFATLGATFGFGEVNAGIGYNYVDEKAAGITHVIALSGDMELVEGIELQADLSYADPEDNRTNLASVLVLELSF
ncbi:MAG: porin [Alphaproteobacteria bacterium]